MRVLEAYLFGAVGKLLDEEDASRVGAGDLLR